MDGFLVMAQFFHADRKILYGPSNKTSQIYDNFETSDLDTFDKREEARELQRTLKEDPPSDLKRVTICKIDLEIAQSVKEFEKLKVPIVVIRDESDSITPHWRRLCGPVVAGKYDLLPIPGAYLSDNGYVPFTGEKAFENARDLVFQLNRQGDTPATIASYRLEQCR